MLGVELSWVPQQPKEGRYFFFVNSRRGRTDRTGTARKFTRKRGARTKLLFYQYNSGALAREACQRSTMGKKIWETIHPRKFGDDVAYERRSSVHPLHVSRYQVSQLSGARNK